MIEHLILLCEHKYQPPQIRDQPRVYRLVAPVSRHKNFWHRGQQTLQRELKQILRQRILINVDDLVCRVVAVNLDHLVTEVHRFAVRVLDALLNISQQESLLPSEHPLA
jgi:hypothetical protein